MTRSWLASACENVASNASVKDGILTLTKATVGKPRRSAYLKESVRLLLKARASKKKTLLSCSSAIAVMESAKIPMRGRVKDAEAEALLRLLRQEKEFKERISAPQIQQRTPLPAIGSSGDNTTQQTTTCTRTSVTSGTFITQTLEDSRFLSSDNEHNKELVNDSSFLWTPSSDISSNLLHSSQKDICVPPFTWRDERSLSYSKYERHRHGRSLPPIEIPSSPVSDLPERPSCPKPGSPKLWED